MSKTVNETGQPQKATQYLGVMIFENNVLQHVATEEGRARLESGIWKLDYFLKDHLGNVRMMLADNGTVLEETHYYPFGLTQKGISSKALNGAPENKQQKFQNAEFNTDFDLNTYEFFYRNYDPQIGRWHGLDPKPTESISLYGAFGNNPIKNVDFLGDTTIYYNIATGAVLGTINNAGAVQRVKVNGDLYNMFTNKLDQKTTDALASNQGVADVFVSAFNGLLDGFEASGLGERAGYGADIISRETGDLSLSFEGRANANNPAEGNGTLNVRSHFDNGSTLNIASYTAIGGPYGNGSPENGAYIANNLRNRRDNPGMIRDGVGFSMDLNPSFEPDVLY